MLSACTLSTRYATAIAIACAALALGTEASAEKLPPVFERIGPACATKQVWVWDWLHRRMVPRSVRVCH